jgi:hypothetical protein
MKKVAMYLYVHRSALDALSLEQQVRVKDCMNLLPEAFSEFTVIKYNTKDNSVSFIISSDFDIANEPTVGDSIKFCSNGLIRVLKSKGQIYHHKWQFVKSDYIGFDINESMKRSELWTTIIPQITEIKSRIGFRRYWNMLLESYNINP